METTATLNPILTVVANQFFRDPRGFVADLIAPRFGASLQAGQYYKFAAADLAQVPNLKPRAPGSPYHRVQTKVGSDSYACENYGLEAAAPDEERKKYASYFDLDKVKVNRIVDTIRVNRELRVMTLVNAATSANIAIPWNDPTSNPKADVDAVCTTIRQKTGSRKGAITMTISEPTFLVLQTHNKLVDLFKFTTPGVLNEEKLALYFGLRRVVVAYNIQATNNEGQTFTAADIWGNQAFFSVDSDAQDLEVPCWARSFYWTQFDSQVTSLDSNMPISGTTGISQPVFTYRDENVKSDIHRGDHYVVEKVVAPDCGYVLNNCLG